MSVRLILPHHMRLNTSIFIFWIHKLCALIPSWKVFSSNLENKLSWLVIAFSMCSSRKYPYSPHRSTAKKVAFTLEKTRGEFTQNVDFAYIYWCSPIGKSKVFQLFCCRWIWVFVPLSGVFPLRWIPENACFLEFTGLLTLGECLVCLCSQMFSRCKTSRSPGVYTWKPAFSLVFQNGKCR